MKREEPIVESRVVLALCADLSLESDCLGVQSKARGKLLVRLNITPRPIANKYSDGKLKRTLKRELRVRETVWW